MNRQRAGVDIDKTPASFYNNNVMDFIMHILYLHGNIEGGRYAKIRSK